jgi:DNA-binding MarR family transcriptional regulator
MTAAGRRLYDQIAPMALEYQARLLSGMERADVERLEQTLRRLEQSAIALSQG